MNRTFRFEDWTTLPDPKACAEYSVECTESGCGAEFNINDDQQAADSWMYRHTTMTGHRSFWQTFGHSVIVGPPPGSIVAARVAEHERSVERQDQPVRPSPKPARSTS
ncbi:hypothetical protein [Streptomyces olivoreticuli]|uniref:DUF7848 domain-containing protein n=1 Tax=Streptomyces olivoreticuli TaxID=68246 RepID=UPI000E24A9AC|nr:hypothetical protein [Streptomyces olivoreticuli]